MRSNLARDYRNWLGYQAIRFHWRSRWGRSLGSWLGGRRLLWSDGLVEEGINVVETVLVLDEGGVQGGRGVQL